VFLLSCSADVRVVHCDTSDIPIDPITKATGHAHNIVTQELSPSSASMDKRIWKLCTCLCWLFGVASGTMWAVNRRGSRNVLPRHFGGWGCCSVTPCLNLGHSGYSQVISRPSFHCRQVNEVKVKHLYATIIIE
jgi:hypothetical protein